MKNEKQEEIIKEIIMEDETKMNGKLFFYFIKAFKIQWLILIGLIVAGLYISSLYNFLLFHTLVEIFSIIIGFTLFIIVWNARRQIDSQYLLFIGITSIFIAVIDLIHTLAYKGMPVFTGYDANLPTQLWIAARYVQSLTFLIALLFINRKVSILSTIITYSIVTTVLLITIFLRIFPVCFSVGTGLTPFKIISEYIIVGILIMASVGLWFKKETFEQRLVMLLVLANILTIASEIAFTTYLNVYGFSNLVGHVLKMLASIMWYLAIIQAGITKPAEILYRQLNESEKKHKTMISNISDVITVIDKKGILTYISPNIEKFFGWKPEDLLGRDGWGMVHPDDLARIRNEFVILMRKDMMEKTVGFRYKCKDESFRLIELTAVNLLKDSIITGILMNFKDISVQHQIEQQLQQARKLESIGQLAAGVAHEINSPLQYVFDNLKFINKTLTGIITFQEKLFYQINAGSTVDNTSGIIEFIKKFMKDSNLDYIIKELPKAAEQCLDGVSRVSKIVQSMKTFAHPGIDNKKPVDINKSIENTVTVSRNEWKYDSDLKLDLDPSLPMVSCFEDEFNQVILNLIINAADAVKQVKQKGLIKHGIINIITKCEGDQAIIQVIDNGAGIPESIRQKIFDPFFTTKEVGKGAGQGLAISHAIIVEKHCGMIYCESKEGEGASFIIKLPLSGI